MKARGNEKAIRIKPQRILKILKWKLDGVSHTDVARRLHTSTSRVSVELQEFEKNWKRLLKFVDDVRKTKYFDKKILPRRGEIMFQAQIRMLENELWPFSIVPTGLTLKNRRLERTPEGDSLILKVFEGRDQNKSLLQLHRETGVPETTLRNMLKNPIYKGEYHYRGHDFFWPRLVIVDPKTWEKVQPTRLRHRGNPPFGWRWTWRGNIEIPENLEKVKRIFEERLKYTSLNRIADIVKLSKSTVWKIITDPVYKKKGIVDAATWKKAQVSPRVAGSAFRERAKKIAYKRKIDIMRVLAELKRASTKDVAEKIGLSWEQTRVWLKRMKEDGDVDVDIPEKPSGHNPSKWYIKQKPPEPYEN